VGRLVDALPALREDLALEAWRVPQQDQCAEVGQQLGTVREVARAARSCRLGVCAGGHPKILLNETQNSVAQDTKKLYCPTRQEIAGAETSDSLWAVGVPLTT
jgi:hypothetical protein